MLSNISPSSKFLGPPKGYYSDFEDYLENNPSAGTKRLLLQEKSTHQQTLIERHHVAIDNGRINLNPWSFITADDRLLFRESSCYGPHPKEHWAFNSLKFPRPHKLHGKSLFLSTRTNYWHLLADELCDLSLLTENRIKLSEFDQIIFEKSPYSAGQELHKIFGLDQIRHVSLQKTLHLECEELHFITGTFCLSKHALLLVRAQILNSLVRNSLKDSKNENKRIIVSREFTHTRRWLNQKKCLEFLQPMGFKCVDTSKMSLSEQVKVFSNAEVILGPHGAGLTNLMFSCPNTKVIEIRSNQQGGDYSSASCFEELSRIMGIEHHIFNCPSIERKDLKGRSIEDADLLPEPKKLKDFLCKSVFY